jgi:nicotinamide-nucleotide amidase
MVDKKDSLEWQVGCALSKDKLTLSVAESCTGGFISHRITNIPGSSDYFELGLITYSNRSKMQILEVPKLILESFGAVSSEVAKVMAENVKKIAKSDLGLAVTGIAGPSGGSSAKPVGLVYIGLASNKPTMVKEYRFHGSRYDIKEQTSEEAMKMLLREIEKK